MKAHYQSTAVLGFRFLPPTSFFFQSTNINLKQKRHQEE